MALQRIAILFLLLQQTIMLHATIPSQLPAPAILEHNLVDIDSSDIVIFNLGQVYLAAADIIEIPVFIESDEDINTLDFSMSINVENLEFLSVIDHTEELQYAAFLNPNDLKLRFTSNSFTIYPVGSQKVVSIRFKVLSGTVYPTDFENIVAYLNGDKCSTELLGADFALSNKEIEVVETLAIPNPAWDIIFIQAEQEARLDLFDSQGKTVIRNHYLEGGTTTSLDVHYLPRGSYTIRIVSKDQSVKTQKIILQ